MDLPTKTRSEKLRLAGTILFTLSFIFGGLFAFFTAPMYVWSDFAAAITRGEWFRAIAGITLLLGWLANFTIFFRLSRFVTKLAMASPWMLLCGYTFFSTTYPHWPSLRLMMYFPFYPWAIGLSLIYLSRLREHDHPQKSWIEFRRPHQSMPSPIPVPSADDIPRPPGKWRNFLLPLLVVAMVFSPYLGPFACGFCHLPQGLLFMLVPGLLISGPIAGILTGLLLRPRHAKMWIFGGLCSGVVMFGMFSVFPAPMEIWTQGFGLNFCLTKHPAHVQQWAISVLDRYEQGKLVTTTNAPYWATGRDMLLAADIPSDIQNLWWEKPSIGIATLTDDGEYTFAAETNAIYVSALTNGRVPPKLSCCIAFSWYETGFLVGRTNFQSHWNPWYLHELMPGVYVFCGEK